MSVVSGRNAHIYALGDPFQFDVPLQPCDEGWNWKADGVRCWEPESLSFQVWENGWRDLEAMEVHPVSGRVEFPRCLSGPVKASGVGRTCSLIDTAEWWTLEMRVVPLNRSALGSSDVQTAVKQTGSSVLLKMSERLSGLVYVELPFARVGAFVGCGNALPAEIGTEITFDHEGVLYEPA